MAQPFSRYARKIKPKAGQRLQYIKGQGYTTAPIAKRLPAAASAAAPTGTGAYGDLLKNEGIFAQDSANIGADNISSQAKRDAAVKSLLFQYNDPANPFSTVGEANRQHKETVANMIANRSARGVAASGGTILAREGIGHDYSKGMYDSLNSVTGQIGSLDANLADQFRQNQGQLGNSLYDAQQRLIGAGIAPVGGVAPGGGGVGGSAGIPGMNRPGTFDLPGAQRSFPNGINPGAQAAPAFNYGSIKAGYTNPYTGKPILDTSVTGTTYNKPFLAQSQAAQANALKRKKALAFAQRGF